VGAPSSYVRRSEWGVPPWAPYLPTFAERSGSKEREREREREKILDFSGLPNEP